VRDEADELTPVLNALSESADGRLAARYGTYRLESVYQPILRRSAEGLVIDGHEALLRPSFDGHSIPVHTFLNAVDSEEAFFVERICRVLHMRNFARNSGKKQRLYLNINPMAFTDIVLSGRLVDRFPERMQKHGLTVEQIVVEVVETMHDDKTVLAEVVDQFRSIGVTIAIDDFGAQHSNFDRVFDLRPDLVKFDRQWLSRCRGDVRAVRFLTGMVNLIKELDVDVSCEGIETETELGIAMDAGFDLFQGYYLGRPAAALLEEPGVAGSMSAGCEPELLCASS
jgi:EAL domain-containing protein (putative c-di-GMP-specific phosphodiesterase class I)